MLEEYHRIISEVMNEVFPLDDDDDDDDDAEDDILFFGSYPYPPS